MDVTFTIHVEDRNLLADLHDWLSGHDGVAIKTLSVTAAPNAQGSVWDVLQVACAAGAPVAAAVRALQLWIESRVTTVHITVGDATFKAKTSDAKLVLPAVKAAAEALETKGTHEGDA